MINYSILAVAAVATSGLTIAAQSSIEKSLIQTHSYATVALLAFSSAALMIAIYLLLIGQLPTTISSISTIPFKMCGGGAARIIFAMGLFFGLSHLSNGFVSSVLLTSQIVAAFAIDAFAKGEMPSMRLVIGVLLMLTGLVVVSLSKT